MSNPTTSQWLLESHQLRCTTVRLEVLDALQQSQKALSLKALQTDLPHVERTTLYRTLQTFLDCGLIHKALENIHGIHYALCARHCGNGHLESDHHHNHLHFQCNECGEVECLEFTLPLQLAPNAGVQIEELDLTARGRCARCINAGLPE